MEYKEIMDNIIAEETLMDYIPEGAFLSPLCIGMWKGEKTDCFFVCESLKENQKIINRKIRIAIKQGTVIKVEIQEVNDVYGEVILNEERTEERRRLKEKYMQLYSKVKEIAFAPSLTIEQKGMLGEFMNSWKGVVKQEIQEKMEREFPEFFQWEEKMRVREVQDEKK